MEKEHRKIESELQSEDIGVKEKIISTIRIAISGGAAVASISNPMIGIIATLLGTAISENLPNFKQKNQRQFIEQLANDFYNLKEEINQDFLKTDEFAYLLNKCLRLALEELNDTKRRAYINILTHASINPNDFNQIDFYLSVLQSLSSFEVHTLAFFNNPKGYLEIRGIEENSVTGGMKAVLKISFPEFTDDEFKMVLKMLFCKGLTTIDETMLGTLTASTGMDIVAGRLKESAKKLVKFASNYENQL